ncbi:MAG: dTDP-4-dehydrorhamnose 3,5-epimerase [Elusimicrobiota bacterium]|jgi:dTDP-4-dehydrorhamnose 3,5-epimerase|nr:dTDP-4-dehydrorhamnose 3,5-epimerase [Elusimicrobiota bacterium]
MTFFDTGFEGLLLWESSSSYYPDNRGAFQELFNQKDFPQHFATYQVNHSYSVPYVVRGLHYQLPPHAQAKIVHVLKGSIYAVALDLRAKSASFGRHFDAEITGENRKHLFIPKGFAYGFAALAQGAVVLYQVDAPYRHQSARVIRHDDKQLAINWPAPEAAKIVSDADAAGMSWADYLKNPVF